MKTLTILALLTVTPAIANPCDDAIRRWADARNALYNDESPEQLSHAITGVPTIADIRTEEAAAGAAVDAACQGKGPSR